jgi:hypothetical protein
VIGLEKILEYRVGDVLNDPALLLPMLKYYSQLYLSGGRPRTCASSHKQYYVKLQQDGLERLKKLTMAKYQLKTGVVITFSGQTYNQGTMTDEIAVNVLEKFPKLAVNFTIKEDVQPKEEVKEAKPKVEEVKAVQLPREIRRRNRKSKK